MEWLHMPGEVEIRAACSQGEQAVMALFQQAIAPLVDRIQALEAQISSSPALDPAGQSAASQQPIQQGEIYWVAIAAPDGETPGIAHPQLVIQENVINRSRVQTVVVCAITSNRSRVSIPGNVLLEAGEANLPRQSVVEVSKVSTVSKTQLREYIGTVSAQRVQQVLAGMEFLQSFTE